jgi:hypothetical protein
VSFAAITLCIASQRVFIVVSVYFVIDSVRKTFGYTFVSNEAFLNVFLNVRIPASSAIYRHTVSL